MIELLWNGPISETKMADVIGLLSLETADRVLDVGCGCGEVLIRMHERYGVGGVGIDSSPDHIAEAKRRAAGRVRQDLVCFEQVDAAKYVVEPDSFELVVCLGSTHAFGLGADAVGNALRQMMSMVVPGGSMLVADGYLKQPADPEYRRRFLGESLPDTMTHASNVAAGSELGLIPLAAWTSSDDEWDDFEWSYQRIVERWFAESPDAGDRRKRLEQRREWMEGYLKWGRETLGFGVYLFQRPVVESLLDSRPV